MNDRGHPRAGDGSEADAAKVGDWRVVPAVAEQLPGIARCHIESFPDVFSSRMGQAFVEAMYARYIEDARGRMVAAIEVGTGEVIGVTAGGRYGIWDEHLPRAVRRYWGILLRKTMCDRVVAKAIFKRLGQLLRRSHDQAGQADPWRQETAAWLQVACVRRQWRSRRVGEGLMQAFLAACREACFLQVFLPVITSNTRAIAFYGREGFRVASCQDDTTILQRELPNEP